MAERDDNRYGEDVTIAFAMYCDENGLSVDEGRDLASRLSDSLEIAADDRAGYVDA